MFDLINTCVNIKICFVFTGVPVTHVFSGHRYLSLAVLSYFETCRKKKKKNYPGVHGWMKIWADVYSLVAGSRKWQGVILGLPCSHEYKLLRKSNSDNWKTQGWRPSRKMGDLDVVSFPFEITLTSFSHTHTKNTHSPCSPTQRWVTAFSPMALQVRHFTLLLWLPAT